MTVDKQTMPEPQTPELRPLHMPELHAMADKARAEGKWLYMPWYGHWSSPDETEQLWRDGKAMWHPLNWRLRDPAECLAEAEEAVQQAIAARDAIAARMNFQVPSVTPARRYVLKLVLPIHNYWMSNSEYQNTSATLTDAINFASYREASNYVQTCGYTRLPGGPGSRDELLTVKIDPIDDPEILAQLPAVYGSAPLADTGGES